MYLQTRYRSKLLTVMKSSPPPPDAGVPTKQATTESRIGSAAAPATSMRELLGRAFMKRTSTASGRRRWHRNTSRARLRLSVDRLRLSLVNARLSVVRNGSVQSLPLDEYVPSAATLPIAIEFPTRTKGVGVAVMRRLPSAGENSPDLSVVTTLRIKRHRFEDVRILVSLDGVLKRATDAENVAPMIADGKLPAPSGRSSSQRESVDMAIPSDDAPRRLRR